MISANKIAGTASTTTGLSLHTPLSVYFSDLSFHNIMLCKIHPYMCVVPFSCLLSGGKAHFIRFSLFDKKRGKRV